MTDPANGADRSLLCKRLQAWPIAAAAQFEHHGSIPGAARFTRETRRDGKVGTIQPVGVVQLADAARVYQLMRDIQQRQPA